MAAVGEQRAGVPAHRRTLGVQVAWLGLALVVLLAWLFARYDEAISQAVRNPDAGWAVVLEMYGQLPGVLTGVVGAIVLLRSALPARSVRGWIAAVVITLILAVSSLQVAMELGAHAGGETNVRQAVAIAIPVAVAAGVVSRWLPSRWVTSGRAAAMVAVALPYLASVVTVWMIKIPWGRWTPRDVSAVGDPSLFSPWYLPQGANGHYSFVSGHTSFAFAVIALVLVAARTRRAFTVGVVGCLVWGLVVASSRVVLGAHFPSDTLFAAVITVVWAVLLARAAGYRPPARAGLPPQAPRSGPAHPDKSSPGREVVRRS